MRHRDLADERIDTRWWEKTQVRSIQKGAMQRAALQHAWFVARTRPHGRAGRKRRSLRVHGSDMPAWEQQELEIEQEVLHVKRTVEQELQKVRDAGRGDVQRMEEEADFDEELIQIRRRIERATNLLQKGLVEREKEVKLLLLATLCREHILFIGPPGTAKSELARRMSMICRGNYFERLLTRFSVPEELFGPLSMKGLEMDQYVRKTHGYLPEASIAFVDEIFKANSAILNALLTILNERLFDNGNKRIPVPLVCLVGASNELPESEELDALYDRFLIRKIVRQVSEGGLSELLTGVAWEDDDVEQATEGEASPVDPSFDDEVEPVLLVEDLEKTRRRAIAEVTVPSAVIDLISDLRTFLQDKCEPPVYVSDRRLVKAVAMLKVAAYTNGRSQVNEFDCLLLTHCFWQRTEDCDKVDDWLLSQLSVDDGAKQVKYLLKGLFARACRAQGDAQKCAAIQGEISQVKELLSSKVSALRDTLGGEFVSIRKHLWIGQDDAEAIVAAISPLMEKNKAAVEDLLGEVLVLEVAMSRRTEPHILAELLPVYWADFIRNGPVER